MGVALKDFPEYAEVVSEGAKTKNIQELKDLMSRQPSIAKRGPIESKILKLLVYGGQQMPDAPFKIDLIRKALKGSTIQRKRGGIRAKSLTSKGK